MANGSVSFLTPRVEDIEVLLLLSDGTTVGFSNPDSATRYIEILDLEDTNLEVVNTFSRKTLDD